MTSARSGGAVTRCDWAKLEANRTVRKAGHRQQKQQPRPHEPGRRPAGTFRSDEVKNSGKKCHPGVSLFFLDATRRSAAPLGGFRPPLELSFVLNQQQHKNPVEALILPGLWTAENVSHAKSTFIKCHEKPVWSVKKSDTALLVPG